MEHAITVREEIERPWEAQSWLRAETLAALAELNEQCLELLAAQARIGAMGPSAALLREIGPLLRSLDSDSRHRAAACPYLLVDAGFGDQQRWTWVSGYHVRDLDRRSSGAFFSIPGVTPVTRQVLTYAWHLTRSQNAAARMLLGMSAHCPASSPPAPFARSWNWPRCTRVAATAVGGAAVHLARAAGQRGLG